MTRTFARLVLCLLIAALPLQGYAAAARACCMAMQTGARTAGQMSAGHCPHEAAAQLVGHTACAGHQHARQHAASGHGAGHAASCAVCAACCTAFLAAAPAQLPPPLLPLLSLAAPAATPLLSGPVPAGLERPPRLRA